MQAGRILVSEKLLLDFLQFPFGEIRNIRFTGNTGSVEITIQDNEMPEVAEGEVIPIVTPLYIKHTNVLGESVAIREPLDLKRANVEASQPF